jgi:hypothetical protein
MSVTVELTVWEVIQAAQAGVMRQAENIKEKRKPAYGAGTENDWQLALEGCLGECALAKHLGIYWQGKGVLRDHDVGNF